MSKSPEQCQSVGLVPSWDDLDWNNFYRETPLSKEEILDKEMDLLAYELLLLMHPGRSCCPVNTQPQIETARSRGVAEECLIRFEGAIGKSREWSNSRAYASHADRMRWSKVFKEAGYIGSMDSLAEMFYQFMDMNLQGGVNLLAQIEQEYEISGSKTPTLLFRALLDGAFDHFLFEADAVES